MRAFAARVCFNPGSGYLIRGPPNDPSLLIKHSKRRGERGEGGAVAAFLLCSRIETSVCLFSEIKDGLHNKRVITPL